VAKRLSGRFLADSAASRAEGEEFDLLEEFDIFRRTRMVLIYDFLCSAYTPCVNSA
jgi:hypothetical protein